MSDSDADADQGSGTESNYNEEDVDNDALSIHGDEEPFEDGEHEDDDGGHEDIDPSPNLGIMSPRHGMIRESEFPADLIFQEFNEDNSLIGVTETEENTFFFVEHEKIFDTQQSVFAHMNQAWRGMEIDHPVFDENGLLIEDPPDPKKSFFELYIPEYLTTSNAYKEREMHERAGMEELRKIVESQVAKNNADQAANEAVKAREALKKAAEVTDPGTITVSQGKVHLKITPSEEEKTKRKKKDIQASFNKLIDPNIPKKVNPSLEFSAALIPVIESLMGKERRLTPSGQKELFIKKYTLNTEQKEELMNLFSLAKSGEEEAAVKSITPPLAKALQKLLEKHSEFHIPLFDMFDELVSANVIRLFCKSILHSLIISAQLRLWK